MGTRTIEVCDVCGRDARNMQKYASAITPDPVLPATEDAFIICGLLCPAHYRRAVHFQKKAFTPTPSGKKRLEEMA